MKKIPALSKNIISKPKKKIASMEEKIKFLNKDIYATEDEMAEYHHWHEAQFDMAHENAIRIIETGTRDT